MWLIVVEDLGIRERSGHSVSERPGRSFRKTGGVEERIHALGVDTAL